MFWRFVSLIDTGEVLDLTAKGPAIKPFRIARDALLDGSIDEDLDEFAARHQFAHHLPFGSEGRDKRAQHDQTGLGHKLRHFANSADILDPVGFGETEIPVKSVTNVIAV